MPQRPIHEDYPVVLPSLVTRNPVDARAIARVTSGGGNWEWDVMNWFVRRAQDDLGNISDGDLLNLQEELVALVRALYRKGSETPLPKLDVIEYLQIQNISHLRRLLDDGWTYFGRFPIASWILIPKRAKDVHLTPEVTPEARAKMPEVVPIESVRPEDDRWLVATCALHLLNRLLKTYAASVERCAHCARIFLQLRRNAHYCNRQCQSVAAMRAIRARKKQKKAGSKRAHLKGSRAQRKESKHG